MDQELKNIWDNILRTLKDEVSPLSFSTWIKRMKPRHLNEEHFYIQVSDSTHLERAEGFKSLIENCFKLLYHREVLIEFFLPDHVPPVLEEKPRPAAPSSSNLISKYTFDNFIVGSSNNFAFSACFNIAENSTNINFDNPLFLYGGSGLGKTHLINAIGNFILSKDSSKRILYIQTEAFVNEFISTIRKYSYTAFREKYRNVDLLMIDDIQFIEGKEQMQQEFFHTFNTLYENGSRIIMTCDKNPSSLHSLEERLRTRFQSGVIVDIQAPDYETRMAILRSKVAQLSLIIPDESLHHIASHISTNIRELEGAFNTFVSYGQLTHDFSLHTAETSLKNRISPALKKKVSPQLILEVVATFYGVNKEDLLSKKRRKEFAFPRQVMMFLCRNELDFTYEQIGAFTEKDHSTVMHAVKKIESTAEHDLKMQDDLRELRRRISD